MRTASNPFGTMACPTDDPNPEPVPGLRAPVRRPRARRPRGQRLADVAVGCKLPSATYARLLSRSAATGESVSALLRRALALLLDGPSTANHS